MQCSSGGGQFAFARVDKGRICGGVEGAEPRVPHPLPASHLCLLEFETAMFGIVSQLQ